MFYFFHKFRLGFYEWKSFFFQFLVDFLPLDPDPDPGRILSTGPTVAGTNYLNLKVNIICSDGKLLSESNSTAYFLASSQLKGGDDSFLQSQVHRVHRQVHTVHNSTLYSLLSSFPSTQRGRWFFSTITGTQSSQRSSFHTVHNRTSAFYLASNHIT